jgi:hypothetical protein
LFGGQHEDSVSTTNKFGLSRSIPEPIKRAVRQACGFGCVVCGASIIEYEHIDPEFHEAREHNPELIALLCHSCHGNVTRKYWSKEKIKAARSAPRCKETGFSWGSFDFGGNCPYIQFAGLKLVNCPTPVAVAGTPVFSIKPPEVPEGPFRLSANFADADGHTVLQITENEWQASATSWDIEFAAGKITIQQQDGEQCLVLRALPPDGIAIEKLQMRVAYAEFTGDTDTLKIKLPKAGIVMTGCVADNCAVGLSL